jgi:mRNA interferase RelE/StbE
MTYNLEFDEDALKEWKSLDSTIKNQFKKKLKERLNDPKLESTRLSGMSDCYKIKLRSLGYRLVYKVIDEKVIVKVISVGKRERNAVYKQAIKRV